MATWASARTWPAVLLPSPDGGGIEVESQEARTSSSVSPARPAAANLGRLLRKLLHDLALTEDQPGFLAQVDRGLGDDAFLDVVARGDLEHRVEQGLLD